MDTQSGDGAVSELESAARRVGELFGNYRLVRLIGEGGMGSVFEAQHDLIGRRVAIKVLRPEIAGSREIASRFLNEARAVNLVQHPGIVDIYEFGQIDAQTLYIVMEYLQGEPLYDRLQRLGGKLPLPMALTFFRQLAATLDAIHEKGIVHRDLKPDNLIVVRDWEVVGGERVKVLDFGIAKLMGEGGGGMSMKTKTGVMMGTPAYMSPEQCDNLKGTDAKADVYSLGVMLFEAVAGRLPFVADGVASMMAAHMSKEPPSLGGLVAEARGELSRLVGEMLKKAPAERPTMREVAGRLTKVGAPRLYQETSESAPAETTVAVGKQLSTLRVKGRVGAVPTGLLLGGLLLGGLLGQVPHALKRGDARRAIGVDTTSLSGGGAGKTVRWEIATTPVKATVQGVSNRLYYGTTPVHRELASETGVTKVRISEPGFEDRLVELRNDRDTTLELVLRPVTSPEPPRRKR